MLRENENLKIKAIPFYISDERSKLSKLPQDIIKDGSIVFICVDNLVSVNLISNYSIKLKNIILIRSGINKENGYVQTFARINGENITPPLHEYNHYVANPKDELPTEKIKRGCLDEADQEKPNIFSLMITDSLSLVVFHSIMQHIKQGTIKDFKTREIFFNVSKIKMRTVASN